MDRVKHFLKSVFGFFLIPMIIVVCLLIGQRVPFFNGVAVVLLGLAVLGIIGSLIWMGVRALKNYLKNNGSRN